MGEKIVPKLKTPMHNGRFFVAIRETKTTIPKKEEQTMKFNPNELILEKIRAVEEYDPATNELTGRYTQIEGPSLKV